MATCWQEGQDNELCCREPLGQRRRADGAEATGATTTTGAATKTATVTKTARTKTTIETRLSGALWMCVPAETCRNLRGPPRNSAGLKGI
eukprot:4602021-Pyramimonas_sp.AAC.1